MGIRQPKTLSDLTRWDANLRVTCCRCGRTGVYATKDMVAYFHARRWNQTWEEVARRFRCSGLAHDPGCGAREARVGMEPMPLPPVVAPPEPLVRDLKAEVRRQRG